MSERYPVATTPLPVEPLDYRGVAEGASSWRPIVRASLWAAVAHAAAVAAQVSGQVAIIYPRSVGSLLSGSSRNMLGAGVELLVCAASVSVIVAGVAALRMTPRADRWVVLTASALGVCMLARSAMHLWTVIVDAWGVRGSGPSFMLGYCLHTVAGAGMTLIVPVLVIWLMRRDEVRRLY